MAADFVKKLPNRLENLLGRERRRRVAGNEVDIPRATESVAISPIMLSRQSFDSVSFYGIADFSAYRDPKPGAPKPVFRKNRNEIPVLNFFAAAGELQIFAVIPNSIVF